MSKPNWIVKMCKTEELENVLNYMDVNGYVIEKYEIMPESWYWVVVGRLFMEE